MTRLAPAAALDLVDFRTFADDIKALRAEIDASLGPDDLRHLRRIERWGRVATAVGLATAPIAPNPLSAAALALGRATRWLLMHHVGHRGYDKVPAVPPRFTARVFARGWRRLVDWLDWMIPEAWIYEHNILHHQHTGETRDPDLIEQNLEAIHRAADSGRKRLADSNTRMISLHTSTHTASSSSRVRGFPKDIHSV